MADWNNYQTRLELKLLKQLLDEVEHMDDTESVLDMLHRAIHYREEKLQ